MYTRTRRPTYPYLLHTPLAYTIPHYRPYPYPYPLCPARCPCCAAAAATTALVPVRTYFTRLCALLEYFCPLLLSRSLRA